MTAAPHTSAFLILLLLAASVASASTASGVRHGGSPKDYLSHLSPSTECEPGAIVVKFSSDVRTSLSKTAVSLSALAPAFAKYAVYRTTQMYPTSTDGFTSGGRDLGIDRMYRIEYAATADPIAVARAFDDLPGIEYAEPERVHHIVYTPNDAMLSQQYALDAMHIKDAWNLTTGSPDVVIAVVDTGVQWTHEDLRENTWINPGEDINHDGKYTSADLNGVDDDGDGYVDDIIGIDFGGNSGTGGGGYYDNNPIPTPTGDSHGTHVSGIIAAIGDNGKGIAGVAYGCRIMPVKCYADAGGTSMIRPYDGIVYAADRGATVINCSWGGAGGYLQSEIDRIDYALSKGSVVVAAAGNNGAEGIFTPAAYPNVLSVASVGQGDRIASYSNYDTWVDVSAPGDMILSTVSSSNSAYAYMSGTSMACPQVAGVLALVASRRPELRGRQLSEQVRVTSDNIDAKQAARYAHKIGYGRVNALRAMTENPPSVQMIDWALDDARTGNGNGIVERGETIEVTMTWKNFLAPTKNAVVTLTTSSPHATIDNPTFQIGALATGGQISNASAPFVVHIADVEALNEEIDLFYTITDDGYSDFGGVSFFQQPTYRDHTVNDILTTVSNDGNIGFDDFSGVRGSGFVYAHNGFNVLFEGALMIGAKVNGTPIVVDVARNETGSVQCADLIGSAPVLMKTPGATAAQEGFTEFTDAGAPDGGRLGVSVSLHSWAFTEDSLKNTIILAYTIRNTSQHTLDDLHAGLFFDWDIGSSATSDFSDFDTTSLTAYAYESGAGKVPTIVGETVLSRDRPTHFVSINNPDPDSKPPVFGIHNGFTKDEKWRSLSSGIWHIQSTVTDISQVIANGPYTLQPGDSCVVAFALMAGLRPTDLIKTTPRVLDAWRRISTPTPTSVDAEPAPAAFSLLGSYPNPYRAADGAPLTVAFTAARSSDVRIELVDALGRTAATVLDTRLDAGRYQVAVRPGALSPGVWFLRMQGGGTVSTARLLVLR